MRRFLAALLAAALAGALPFYESGTQAEAPQGRTQRQRFQPNPNGVVGRYIVRLADSAAGRRGRFSRTPEVAAALSSSYQISQVRRTYTYALNGFSADMSEVVARRLSTDPRVQYVTQVTRASVTSTTQPNAPWGLDRIDQETGTDTTYTYDNSGAGVTVYVLDSGIRTTLGDFQGRASLGPAYLVGYPYATADDCLGHGTHVAGTIGGQTYGVAKGVDLVSVRVIDCYGFGDSDDIIAGIDWITAYHQAPAVGNASLSANTVDEDIDEALRNSIAAGVTWVVAAGNHNDDVADYSPSRVSEAIIVAATTDDDNRWQGTFSSNFGNGVDLFAPGAGIVSTEMNSPYYGSRSGTSMAAPHVAGIAARYLGLFPTASPAAVEGAIIAGATDNLDIGSRNGAPDLLANSEFLDDGPPPPNTPACGDYDCLFPADALYPGWNLESANMQYLLSYQGDGNLVLYDSSWNVLWAANTGGTDANTAVMQGDGNFVVYDDTWTPRWASDTSGNSGAWLILQNDGNLVIYEANNGPPIISIRYECGPQCS